MEVLFDFLKSVVCGVGIAAFIWYCIMRPIANLPYKQWDRKMKNPPPPPKRECEHCNGSGIWANLSTPLHTYQFCPPCRGTGHINPPKETGI